MYYCFWYSISLCLFSKYYNRKYTVKSRLECNRVLTLCCFFAKNNRFLKRWKDTALVFICLLLLLLLLLFYCILLPMKLFVQYWKVRPRFWWKSKNINTKVMNNCSMLKKQNKTADISLQMLDWAANIKLSHLCQLESNT